MRKFKKGDIVKVINTFAGDCGATYKVAGYNLIQDVWMVVTDNNGLYTESELEKV